MFQSLIGRIIPMFLYFGIKHIVTNLQNYFSKSLESIKLDFFNLNRKLLFSLFLPTVTYPTFKNTFLGFMKKSGINVKDVKKHFPQQKN